MLLPKVNLIITYTKTHYVNNLMHLYCKKHTKTHQIPSLPPKPGISETDKLPPTTCNLWHKLIPSKYQILSTTKYDRLPANRVPSVENNQGVISSFYWILDRMCHPLLLLNLMTLSAPSFYLKPWTKYIKWFENKPCLFWFFCVRPALNTSSKNPFC